MAQVKESLPDETWTVKRLQAKAITLSLPGYRTMNKCELIKKLRFFMDANSEWEHPTFSYKEWSRKRLRQRCIELGIKSSSD